MPKILLVKTSSMGDVIHNLPVVSDILAHFPEAEIDWVVEESFAGIPALHPGMGEIIPVAVRRWRKNLFSRTVYAEISTFITRLRSKTYDVVLDTQGLIKSAIITRLAQGARCGFDLHSAREPLAALFYDKTLRIEKNQNAVVRNRLLAGLTFGYSPDDPVNYGIATPPLALPWLPTTSFVVLLHATSRDDKLWPEADWIALGAYLAGKGVACVLPWGSASEQQRSQRLARRNFTERCSSCAYPQTSRNATFTLHRGSRRGYRTGPSGDGIERTGHRHILCLQPRPDGASHLFRTGRQLGRSRQPA